MTTETEEATRRSVVLDFPEDRYPTGWFQVAYSDTLAIGEVRPIHYFGQELVLWRDHDGQARVMDAYCLHFGAHLGVKGRVEGTEIVCPWHGWKWAGDGRNTEIPYDTVGCKQHLRIRSWPVVEQYGAILTWHDRAGREPLWQLETYEELEDGEFYEIGPDTREEWRIVAHVQNPTENGADPAHIIWVHGAHELPSFSDFRFEGHLWEARLAAAYGKGKGSTWLTPDGGVSVSARFSSVGIGLGRAQWFEPFLPAIMFFNVTPIDDRYCQAFQSMSVKRVEGEDRPSGAGKKFIAHQMKTTEQDFFTWEHMSVIRPNFTPLETKFWAPFRRWCSMFYSRPDGNDRLAEIAAYRDVVIDGRSDA